MTVLNKLLTSLAFTLLVFSNLTAKELAQDKQETITHLCKNAIEKKGYGEYKYKYVEVIHTQSNDYSMIGQLHNASKRYEFNCLLNKDINIKDLVVNALD